jgi:hypothetical protein
MSIRTDWKQTAAVALSLALLGLVSCGGSKGPATSGLSRRAFVSDTQDGTLHIEDAEHDLESPVRISTGSQPGVMRLSPDKSITLVFNAGSFSLAVVTNSTESLAGSIGLPSLSTDYVAMPDNTVAFAVVPNSSTAPCTPRCVEIVDVANTFTVTGTINADTTGQPLNGATTLVPSPDHSKLLVFGGPGEHVDTLAVIDTTTAQTTPASAATQLGPDPAFYDRPVSAVFSSDSSKAYILNCGPECGGTAASVTVLDMTSNPPVPVTNIPMPGGATVGLLSGNNLFVAGTPSGTPGSYAGQLSVLDTTALAPPATSVSISDGYHNLMELGNDNKLFIGATPICTAGCLTIFDMSNNQAKVDPITGNVSGIASINGRHVVYVIEDVAAESLDCQGQLPCLGKLRIYDTTASTPTFTPTQINVVGKAVDVKYVDK